MDRVVVSSMQHSEVVAREGGWQVSSKIKLRK